jgi:hypothetical protein
MLALLVINIALTIINGFVIFLAVRTCMVVNDKIDSLKSAFMKNTESNFKYVEAIKRSME